MEVEPTRYSLRFGEDREVLITEDVLKEFGTLQNMVADFGSDAPRNSAGNIVIPLEVEGLTPDIMQSMIDFYVLEKNVYRDASEQELIELITLTDYLEAIKMLLALIDILSGRYESLSLSELEERYLTLTARKRKATKEEDSEEKGIPIRPQYRRAWFIAKILSTLITSNLVRGVDQRIEKYVHLLANSSSLTTIRYGVEDSDVILYNHQETYTKFQVKGAAFSLERGRNRLYRGDISEFVVGNTFLGALTKESAIEVYGEYYAHRGKSSLPSTKDYQLREGEEALGIWGGSNFVVTLTNNALSVEGYLFRHQVGKSVHISTNVEWLRTILAVSAGSSHVLILTTKGLYSMGENNNNALGSNYTATDGKVLVLLNTRLDSNEIAKIYASGSYSIILTKSGELHHSGLSHLGGYESENAWPRIELPESVRKAGKISLISGSQSKLLILAGNTLFTLETSALYTPEFKQEADLPDTIIDAIVLRDNNSLLVATPGALYLYTTIRDSSVLAELGGSESTESPYKLKMPFNIQASTTTANESKKKPRLDCQYCFAAALFRDKTRDNLLCSRYCQYKGLSALLK